VYVKLFASLYQGTLRGKPDEILVFTNMLAHADQHGMVDMHFRAIAEEVGITIERVKAAVINLEMPDQESRSHEEEGKRLIRLDEHREWGWRVVNYLKYRAIRNEDDRREQNRAAQEKFRNKSNQNKPRKPMSAHTEAEAEALTTNTTGVQKRTPFVKPSVEEVEAYCQERRNDVSVASWFDHYDTNGWKVGRNSMKDWRASIRTWERNERGNGNGKTQQHSKPSLAERATNARKEYERSIGLSDTVRAIDGEFVGTYEPPVRT